MFIMAQPNVENGDLVVTKRSGPPHLPDIKINQQPA